VEYKNGEAMKWENIRRRRRRKRRRRRGRRRHVFVIAMSYLTFIISTNWYTL
jgi:hypothetical protein